MSVLYHICATYMATQIQVTNQQERPHKTHIIHYSKLFGFHLAPRALYPGFPMLNGLVCFWAMNYNDFSIV